MEKEKRENGKMDRMKDRKGERWVADWQWVAGCNRSFGIPIEVTRAVREGKERKCKKKKKIKK